MYIGYSYYQKSTSYGLSVVKSTTDNGLYVKIGDEEWADRSDVGTLSVEAFVYGDNLPKVNLSFDRLDVGDSYIINRGEMDICGTVENLATVTVSGFDVNVAIDGVEGEYIRHIDCSLPIYGKHDFAFTIHPDITGRGSGKGHMRVSITNIVEGEDEDTYDNVREADFVIVNQDNARHVLIEEFTTERCSNCPRLAGYIHNALQKEEYQGLVHVVCHHSGYYTDWLTADCDESYLWLFNTGGVFAPAMMADRFAFDGTTLALAPASQNNMENYWIKRLAEPAPVSLSISAKINGDSPNILHVAVTCEKSVDELCANPMLTVFVVENNIDAHSQAGTTNFVHQHVTRAFNATWGVPIVWNGNDYEYECDFTMDDSWVRKNLEIVAFVANYNPENATDCAVLNSNAISSEDVEVAGITSIYADDKPEAEYYTLSGFKIKEDKATNGIFIVKQGDTVRKVVVVR